VIALALAAHSDRFARRYDIERRLSSGVALTFDDGPHPEGTPAVLEALAARGATATFFVVGEQVRRRPELVRRIVAAGHEVALHGDRHVLLLRRRPAELAADFDRALATIADAAGLEPRLYRPPYGVFSPWALREVRRRGWRPLLWSAWGRDWERRATPASIARRAAHGLAAGEVVLLHDSDAYSSADSWRRTSASLPSLLDAAASRSLSCVSVTQAT
jgi:peptidoglycan/xylan/chitin deacetylase (PgdA/CDA1 family)